MSGEPTKEQLPGELRRALDAMSDEALQAASHTFIESGLDPNRGGASLDETLVNLTHARDVLSGALDTGKFVQSPLRIQHDLYGQVQALDGQLAKLAKGKDALSALQAGVEKLNEEVWQYRLLDVSSDGALGFHARMNQLKSHEALIRKAVRAAGEFDGLLQNADRMIESITERATEIAAERASTAELVTQLQTILRESTEISQKMATLGTQAARQESIATKQLIAARQAFAETEAVATKSKGAQATIDAGRDTFKKLTAHAQQVVATTESAAKASLTKQLQEFTAKSEAAVAGFATESAASLAAGNDELKRLVAHLDELEDQVEKAMERATGASLFQAFQRRQLDMLGAKKFWGNALGLSVLVLLAVVGYFVYTLPLVTAYDAAFYTRLSIVIPVTWVVGFCSFRYSRERKRAREFNESLPPSLQAQAG
jgi:hypothetical protein